MGIRTDEAIREFQRRAGIEPPTGERARVVEAASKTAHELIEVCALERSGIRDGDGGWHGSDAVEGLLAKLADLRTQLINSEVDKGTKEQEVDPLGGIPLE